MSVGSGILPISRKERGIKCLLLPHIAKSAISVYLIFQYMTLPTLPIPLAGSVSSRPAIFAMVKELSDGLLQMEILISNTANVTH
jgi:hypothetical protein